MKIEYVKTADLVPYENNAKIHTSEQIEQIKKSIEEFGFNDPIAVWKDNEIIEGHGRLIAAKDLGIETVPVIRLDNLTDEQRKAYALVHNKLTMNTGFDFELLDLELESIGLDMEQFGFVDFDFGYLDEIDGYNEKSNEKPKEDFAMTFLFPNEYKEELEEFVKKQSKEKISKMIIDWMKEEK